MAAFTLTLRTDEGFRLMRAGLSRFEASLADLRAMWPDIIDKFKEIEVQQFRSQGHGKWAALSPAYAAWKARHYPGKSILIREGNLYDAMTQNVQVRVRSKSILQLDFNNAYWQYHQTGTSRMPARPPVDLSNADVAAIMKVPQRYLVQEARRAGLEMR